MESGQLEQALDIRIPSDVQYIEEIVEQVVARCEAYRFARRHLALNVPVALTEALSNAILLEVRDEGPGFDLAACSDDPTTPENLLREDGRGLFLMQRLMDRVERFSDGGNVVRLTLRRS
jgi:anti-sigma regulatory factor (Ser/Thr protein kinase)